jgi:hypothetical protein
MAVGTADGLNRRMAADVDEAPSTPGVVVCRGAARKDEP